MAIQAIRSCLSHSHLISIFESEEDCARPRHFVICTVRPGVSINPHQTIVKQVSIFLKLVLLWQQFVIVKCIHGDRKSEHVESGCVLRNSEVACLSVENFHSAVFTVVSLSGPLAAEVGMGRVKHSPLFGASHVARRICAAVVGDHADPLVAIIVGAEADLRLEDLLVAVSPLVNPPSDRASHLHRVH